MNRSKSLSPVAQILNSLHGWVEWKLINSDGSVAQQGRQDNIVTNWGRRAMVTQRTFPTVLVLLDDEHPASLKKGPNVFRRDAQTPSPYASYAYAYDAPTYTRSLTASWAASSAPPRVVRKIGLAFQGDRGASTGTACLVAAYLSLDPPISQGSGQTLELVYRQQMTIPGKTLVRWAATHLPNLRRFAHLGCGGVNGTSSWNSNALTIGYRSSGIAYGKHYFSDQELRQAGLYDDQGVQGWRNKPNGDGGGYGGGNDESANGVTASRAAALAITTSTSYNSEKIGAFGVVAATLSSEWGGGSDTETSNGTRSRMNASLGVQPLATIDGLLSTVFPHPTGRSYFFNETGIIASSQGVVEVMGPYRPEDQIAPYHAAYAVLMDTSGGTGSGTEAAYHIKRGPFAENGWFTSDVNNGTSILWRGYGNNATVRGSNDTKTSVVYDGKGTFWVVGPIGSTGASLHFWKAYTQDEISPDQLVSDGTRYHGLEDSAVMLAISLNGNRYAPCSLATDGDGTVFFGKRGSAGSQAVFVINNSKPSRYYQRPSGNAAGGNHTFTVNANDEIHAMDPFVIGDVDRYLRIEESAGVFTTRKVTAVNTPFSVNLDGANLPVLSDATWHWVTVTKRGASTGLADQPRVLKYDTANGRLWAFTDTGIQMSTDAGASWSTLLDESNGLSTADAKVVRPEDGENGHTTVAIGNAGELYWIDTTGGVNKYVGTGPGGTHSRIAHADLPGTKGSAPDHNTFGLAYDKVACHMATTEGTLWIHQSDDGSTRSFWRLDCDDALHQDNLVTYTAPDITGLNSSYSQRGPTCIIPCPDGRVYFRNKGVPHWWYFKGDDNTFVVTDDFWTLAPDYYVDPGALTVTDDGKIVQFIHPAQLAAQGRAWQKTMEMRWNPNTSTWIPWHGTASQFDARYGTTNGGKKLAHANYQLLRDNVRVRFVQAGGAVPQTSEFVSGEFFTFVASFGVHRTNIQDVSWYADNAWADAYIELENETVRTVADKGSLATYWQADNAVVNAGVIARALGASGFNLLASGGVNYGWSPHQTSILTPDWYGAGLPNTLNVGGRQTYQTLGLDLGAAVPVDKIRINGFFAVSDQLFMTWNGENGRGQWLVYCSDTGADWVEVSEVCFKAGGLNGSPAESAGSANVYFEQDVAVMGPLLNSNDTRWVGVTFDLAAAGLSELARTHRYWRVIITYDGGYLYNDRFENNSIGLGSIAAFDSDDKAIGVANDLRLPEAHDPNFLCSTIYAAAYLQDWNGHGGIGGVSSAPDSYADGFTNTVTLDTGSFDTGACAPGDKFAWRDPTTGTFLRPTGSTAGSPGAFGEQTEVEIVTVTADTIVVSGRVIPDNLAGVDWEVRRPATISSAWATAAGTLGYDPATGYLHFHPDDVGRKFKITRRSVIMRA